VEALRRARLSSALRRSCRPTNALRLPCRRQERADPCARDSRFGACGIILGSPASGWARPCACARRGLPTSTLAKTSKPSAIACRISRRRGRATCGLLQTAIATMCSRCCKPAVCTSCTPTLGACPQSSTRVPTAPGALRPKLTRLSLSPLLGLDAARGGGSSRMGRPAVGPAPQRRDHADAPFPPVARGRCLRQADLLDESWQH